MLQIRTRNSGTSCRHRLENNFNKNCKIDFVTRKNELCLIAVLLFFCLTVFEKLNFFSAVDPSAIARILSLLQPLTVFRIV